VSVTLLIVIAVDPLFVSVAVFCPPIPPTLTETQLREVGLTDALPPEVLPPVPDNATVCGLLPAVSETVSAADRVPATEGLNAMETLQEADAARLDPHVLLLMTKSPGLVPVTETLLMVIAEVVLLDSVADWAALVEPVFTDPNEREVGLMLTDPLDPPGA
jgi:hypothetical protein